MIAYRCEKDQRNLPQWNPYTVTYKSSGTNLFLRLSYDNYFRNNSTFNEPVTIGTNVISCSYMFANCKNFNSPVQIGAMYCSFLFMNCYRLNSPVEIKPGVVNCIGMFQQCEKFNQNVQIPETIEQCSNMFTNCYNLDQNIQLPNEIRNASNMFRGCRNLNQNIQLPNRIRYASNMFRDCNRLNQNIQIPDSAVYCNGMFYGVPADFGNLFVPSYTTDISCMFYSYNKVINVYINGDTYRDLKVAALFGGAATSVLETNTVNRAVRKNIFFNKVLNNIFNRTKGVYDSDLGRYDYSTIVGHNANTAMITWNTTTNGFYNKTYNIYCYYNYPG